MRSPLTGHEACTPVLTIQARDLVELYRWQRDLDISSEIRTDELTLWYDPVADFHFFDPPCAGSSEFYRELTARPLYAEDKQEYRFAAAHLEAGERLLDVGCGWGLFAAHASKVEYHGLELSEPATEHCRSRGLDVQRRFIQEVASESPESFDAVTSFQVLEHIENPKAFFADCVRCVRPGGKLIVSVPNSDGFMGVRTNNYLNYPPHHVSWWTLNSLLWLGDQAGLGALAVHADRARGNELAMHHGAMLHAMLRHRGRAVRNGLGDRALLKLCDGVGKVLARMPRPQALAPRGHSITVLWRKAQK